MPPSTEIDVEVRAEQLAQTMLEDYITDEGAWVSDNVAELKRIFRALYHACSQEGEHFLGKLNFQVFCSMAFRYSNLDDADDESDSDESEEDTGEPTRRVMAVEKGKEVAEEDDDDDEEYEITDSDESN